MQFFQAAELHSQETRMKKSKRLGSGKFSLRLESTFSHQNLPPTLTRRIEAALCHLLILLRKL